jgi:hypothetical protein
MMLRKLTIIAALGAAFATIALWTGLLASNPGPQPSEVHQLGRAGSWNLMGVVQHEQTPWIGLEASRMRAPRFGWRHHGPSVKDVRPLINSKLLYLSVQRDPGCFALTTAARAELLVAVFGGLAAVSVFASGKRKRETPPPRTVTECPRCQQPLEDPRAPFCSACGKTISNPAAPQAKQRQAPSLAH